MPDRTELPFFAAFQVPEAQLDRIAAAHVRESHKVGFESCVAHSDHCSICWLIATLERVAVEYEPKQPEGSPYTPEQARVAKYLHELTGIGGGEDPIGFLIASHAQIVAERKEQAQDEAQIEDIVIRHGEMFVVGTPGRDHNCDSMGCNSICHVLFRKVINA